MKVAIVQTPIKWEDKEFNLDRLATKLSFIKEETDLVILPEMFQTGFSMETELAETMNGETVSWMKQVAKEEQVTLAGSVMIKEEGKIFNRLIIIHEGKLITYNKRHLFGLAKEDESYTPGDEKVIAQIGDFKGLLQVCYDLRFPVFSRNTEGYDFAIYVANWPEKRNDAWKTLLKARAIENQCYVLACNRVGSDGNGHQYSGDSQIIAPDGSIIAELAPHQEGIIYADLDSSLLKETREKLPFLKDQDTFQLKL